MPPGKELAQQPADAAEQQRQRIENARDQDHRRPRRRRGVEGQQQAGIARQAYRRATAITIIAVMSRAQNRPIAAGTIMMPTASSVPSAWKPDTRLITSSARKIRCAGPPALLTERR